MKFVQKTADFEQKMIKINETIEKIDNQFESIENLQAVIEQLLDNHTDLKRLSDRADEDPGEARWVKFEFDRVAGRTETFFNLAQSLIRKIEKSSYETLTVLTEIANQEAPGALSGISCELNMFDKALLTQLCNVADEKGFTVFDPDKHAKKFGQEVAYIRNSIYRLEHCRMINRETSLDGNTYQIQICNFSEDMREPLSQ